MIQSEQRIARYIPPIITKSDTLIFLSVTLKLWVQIPSRRGVLDTILCDKLCLWIAAGQWFSPGTPVSFTNKTDCHDIAEIL
jgi:hypothetical protein